MVTSAFEGSSSEQLADPGLQLGSGHNLTLTLCLVKPSFKKDWKLKPIIQMGSGARVDPLTPTAFTPRQWWRFWSRWSGSAQKPTETDDVEGEGCEEDAWVEGSLIAQVDTTELLMHNVASLQEHAG